MNTELSAGLAKVRARFLIELEKRRAVLNYAYGRLDNDAARAEAIEEICSIAHKIAGTAGTLGFGDLGAQAATTEDAIRQHLDGQAVDDATIRAEIIQLIDLAGRSQSNQ